MSMAIGHFAAGASSAFLVLNLLPPQIRRKVPDYGFIGILAGVWAMVPDLALVFSHWNGWHDRVFTNLFFLHQVLDILDVNEKVWISAILVGFMVVLMIPLIASDYWNRRTK
jgi:hypothetical protein